MLVHGVTAATEHLHPGLGREVSPGGDDTNSADDFRAVGAPGSSLLGTSRVGTDAQRGERGTAGGNPAEEGGYPHGLDGMGLTLRLRH